jgi:NAD(P)H-dependent flavin oxidoreductase YrpB (nitropropane dioxygenase family)
VDIPVIASGGFGDGRGLVAALALGASGINMGTRFMATQECAIHPKVKEWLVKSSERDTMFVMRSLRNTERVLRNATAEKVVEMEKRSATIEELASLLSGKRGLELYETGALDRGIVACGQVVGLVHDIPTVKELIDRIIKEAEDVASRITARGTFKPLRKPGDIANKP